MNFKPIINYFVIVLFFSLINIGHVTAEEKKISIAIELNWAPFASKDLKGGGYTTEIAKIILERIGYKVNLAFLPWQRALTSTQDGKYAGLPGIYYTQERAKTLAYTDAISTTKQVFFKKKEKRITYKGNLRELIPYKIGVIRGYAHSKEFDDADFLKIYKVSNLEQLIEMLLLNRIDLFVESKKSTYYMLQKNFPKDKNSLETLDLVLKSQKIYMSFSRKFPNYKDLITKFNRTLKIIQTDGTIEKLDKKYGFKK